MVGAILDGGLIAKNMEVSGSVLLNQIDDEEEKETAGAFISGGDIDLSCSHIDKSLMIDIEFVSQKDKLKFNLYNVNARTLCDLDGFGFPSNCVINMGGFTYQNICRIIHESSHKNRKLHKDNFFEIILTDVQNCINSISNKKLCGANVLLLMFLISIIYVFGTSNIYLYLVAGVFLFYIAWLLKESSFGCGRWTKRLRWLNLQYKKGGPNAEEYMPEPYEQLVRVFHRMGHYHDAHKILIEKLKIERKYISQPFYRFFLKLYELGFSYGLSPFRSVVTYIIFILIGWGGVYTANGGSLSLSVCQTVFCSSYFCGENNLKVKNDKVHPILVLDTTNVKNLVSRDADAEPVMSYVDKANSLKGAIPCGKHINSLLYAIDIFVPTLDLHQESVCSVEPSHFGWGLANTIYIILGWIVTALTLLTVSGILRRNIERGHS